MNNQAKIVSAIYSAIDSINDQLPPERKLRKDAATPLAGVNGLDSLELVNLIVTTEDRVTEAFGQSISLADSANSDGGQTAFRTVGTLAEHISVLLQGENRS
jgi:acyl carrier protein